MSGVSLNLPSETREITDFVDGLRARCVPYVPSDMNIPYADIVAVITQEEGSGIVHICNVYPALRPEFHPMISIDDNPKVLRGIERYYTLDLGSGITKRMIRLETTVYEGDDSKDHYYVPVERDDFTGLLRFIDEKLLEEFRPVIERQFIGFEDDRICVIDKGELYRLREMDGTDVVGVFVGSNFIELHPTFFRPIRYPDTGKQIYRNLRYKKNDENLKTVASILVENHLPLPHVFREAISVST